MPVIKKKKKVKIAEARRFKDHIGVSIEEEGRITAGVTPAVILPSSSMETPIWSLNLLASAKEIDRVVEEALYIEIGERVPELEGREIEVEYEEEIGEG
ncbi:hypothetical protein ES703_114065 [subsurface metagenome]